MGFYREATKEEKGIVKEYTKFLEKVRISNFIQINNSKYREIIFNKKHLEHITGTITGTLYIDENNNVVKDRDLLRRLCRISYFSEIMFDDNSNLSLERLLKTDGELNKEKVDYEGIELALGILKENGAIKEEERTVLISIISSFYDTKKRDNDYIAQVVNHCETAINGNNNIVTEQMIDKIYMEYVKILLDNYTRVKELKVGESLFNVTLDKAKKFKRKVRIKWSNKNQDAFNRLEYGLYYYIKVINTYASINGMNKSQYERQIKNIEKDNIDVRIKTLRNLQ